MASIFLVILSCQTYKNKVEAFFEIHFQDFKTFIEKIYIS